MKQEILDIIKGIMVVIGITTATIFVCLRIMDRNYVYFINYFQGDHKYEIKIGESYNISMDVSYLCKTRDCIGFYDESKKINASVKMSKEDVKALIKEFDLKKGVILETNENRVSDKQKELILKVIQ